LIDLLLIQELPKIKSGIFKLFYPAENIIQTNPEFWSSILRES